MTEEEMENELAEVETEEVEVLPPEDAPEAPEEKKELMSQGDVNRQKVNTNWATGLSDQVGVGISIDGNGLTTIDPGTDPEKVKGALAYVSDIELSSANMRQVMQMSIGKFIAFIAASEIKDRTTVISELGVCDSFGRKLDTVLQWVRVAEEIPNECLSYGLSMSHYIAAAVVRKPKDKVDLADFIDLRREVLNKAKKSPSEYPSRQIKRELESFVESVAPSTRVRPDISAGKLKARVLDLRRFRDAASINPDILDEQATDMGSLSSDIEAIENELIERDELVADATMITIKADSEPDKKDEKTKEKS